MVKSYNKYDLTQTFGLVASSLSNVVSVPTNDQKPSGPGNAVVGANEEVLVWDVKKGEQVGRWKEAGCTSQVTCIERSITDPDIFAVGYLFYSYITRHLLT
jgi:U3 small nucleolar RNA-associated protein 12